MGGWPWGTGDGGKVPPPAKGQGGSRMLREGGRGSRWPWKSGGSGQTALTSPLPTADAKVPPETLRFHPEAKGAQVHLDRQRSTACRRATFHDGIVFSQRPVRPRERVALRVLGHQGGWYGGLRVGFTRLDPAYVSAPSLPPFLCPDLEQQSPTWAAMLPNGCALAGDMVCFWVNRRGWLWAQVNAGPRLLLRKGVRMGAPLWAVMDVYGTTKAIELLGEASRTDWVLPLGGSRDSGGAPPTSRVPEEPFIHIQFSPQLLPVSGIKT